MTTADDPQDAQEQARIAVVHAFDILDTPPDGTFDRIAAVAARTFEVPIGIVSIVDTDRIWFKPADALVLPNTKRAANRVVVRTPASNDGDTATCTLLPSNFGSAVRTRAVSQTP